MFRNFLDEFRKQDTHIKLVIFVILLIMVFNVFSYYHEFGYDKVKEFVLKYWNIYFKLNVIDQVDSKTKLQEYSLKKYKKLPSYKLISNSGPRHKPIFKIGVKLKNTNYVYATGSSKKNAEQKSAQKLLKKIGI